MTDCEVAICCELAAGFPPAVGPSPGVAAQADGEMLVVSRAGSLASLASQWNSLAGERPFCVYEWLAPWWRHYGAGKELFTLTVRNERDELVGIAPWSLERSLSAGA